jgi:hypothetical protein
MPSTLSWLDFAESDRQRAMQVIDLFREKGTVDELGFAPIRDAFADYFFPGTSTIQTRARYFLFVPWIMLRYERRKLSVQERASKLRMRETRLINSLLEGCEDAIGIIGREAQASLRRMPSSVYWRGLHLWGIRLFAGSIDQYFGRLSRDRDGPTTPVLTDDGEPIGSGSRNWHPSLPPEPGNLYESATLALSNAEAQFLRDRICTNQPESMLAHLVTRAADELNTDFGWDSSLRVMLPSILRSELEHARLFAVCAWGGPLIYSRMIATMKPRSDELLEKLDVALEGWQSQLAIDASKLGEWNSGDFWAVVYRISPRLSPRTKDFAEQWIAVARRAAAGETVWTDERVQALIVKREGQLKGGRARLQPDNLRARDRWQGDAGGGPMDYRWRSSQIIINDILRGIASSNGGEARDA